MPTRFREDDTPVVEFDPRLEMSPFTLFRRLREGRPPLLIDVRDEPVGETLRGAKQMRGDDWHPPSATEVVLFDEDGSEAVSLAARFQKDGHEDTRALFGGLQLYRFALEPEVVGEETYLVAVTDSED